MKRSYLPAILLLVSSPAYAAAASLNQIFVDDAHVALTLSAPVQFNIRYDRQGPRIVVDLDGAQNKIAAAVESKGTFVRRVTAAPSAGKSGEGTQVVIELAKGAMFVTSWDGPALIVWLGDFQGDAKAPPAESAPAAPQSPPSPSYLVQAGPFPHRKQALALKGKLDQRFSPIIITTRSVAGKIYFQLSIGPLDDKKEADMLMRVLTAAGHKPVLIKSK